MIHRTQATP